MAFNFITTSSSKKQQPKQNLYRMGSLEDWNTISSWKKRPFISRLLQDQRSGKTKATNVTLTNGGSGGGSYGGGGGYGGPGLPGDSGWKECHLGVLCSVEQWNKKGGV